MVRRADHQAVGIVHLQELQERVQHAPNLADVVGATALSSEGIELVEEVDAARPPDGIEDQSQLGGGLAHVLGDEPVELNGEQGQAQLSRQGRRGHRLTGAGRSDE